MNQNIVITGGSRGIGAAMVEAFAKQNNHVLFAYNKSENQARQLEKSMQEQKKELTSYRKNVTRTEKK